MKRCSEGSVIFGWYAGLSRRIVKASVRVQIKLEAGNTIGNKAEIKSSVVNCSKLINIETTTKDIREILSGIQKANKYYNLEFVNKNTVADKMINKLGSYYVEREGEEEKDMKINYAKYMACYGVEISHRDDLSDIINLEAIENRDINEISSDFLIIKLIEKKFLEKIMEGKYAERSIEDKRQMLDKNIIRVAIPLTQIEEVMKDFQKFLKNKM